MVYAGCVDFPSFTQTILTLKPTNVSLRRLSLPSYEIFHRIEQR